MDIYNKFKQNRKAERKNINAGIRDALSGTTPRTAGLMFDLSRGDRGERLDNNRRAHIKAMELVSGLLGKFSLPVRPVLEYHGMVKKATDSNGIIEEGVIKIGVTLSTLLGHKARIDVPVIVRNKSLMEPAVFFYNEAPFVMCASAVEALVQRGSLYKELPPRRMFTPPTSGMPSQEDYPRTPIINYQHMFSPGARNPFNFRRNYSKHNEQDSRFNAWMGIDKEAGEPRKRTNIDVPTEMPPLWPEEEGAMLDEAERDMTLLFGIGSDVVADSDIQVRERGGGALIVPKGEEGKVVKSMEDGKMLYVHFPVMCMHAVVPKCMLRNASLNKIAQSGTPDFIDQTLMMSQYGQFLLGGSGQVELEGEEGSTAEGYAFINESGQWSPWDRSMGSTLLAQKLNTEGWSVHAIADAMPIEQASWSKSGSRRAATVDQVKHEIRQMLREGYQDVDIKDAISSRYPEQAGEALQGLL